MKRGGKRVQSAGKHRYQLRRHLAFGLACALTLPMWSTGFSLAADTGSDPASAYVLEADSTPYVLGPDSTPCVVVGDRQVTDWQWVDEEEMLVRASGVWHLSLPGAGPELAVDREVLQALLPARLKAVLQDGLVEELELTWDLSAVPEEGAYEGSYPLTASLPGGYSLAETAPALEVQLELGGAGMYAQATPFNVALNEWEWEGLGKGAEACITINTNGIQSKGALLFEIKKRLPSRIYGWSTGDKSVNDGAWTYANKQENIVVKNADGAGNDKSMLCSYGYLDVSWSSLAERDLPELSALNSDFTIHAPIPSYDGRKYFVNGGNNTASVEKLPIKIHPISYATHTVPVAAPGNVTVNLFDYYVEDGKDGSQSGVDDRLTKDIESGSGYETQSSSEEVWNNGINKDRLLLFGEASMVHAGFWNIGAGASRSWGKVHTNMKGIVEPVLGEDGYPHIDLDKAREGKDSFNVGDITNVKYAEDAQGSPGHNLSTKILTNAQKKSDGTIDNSLAYLFSPNVSVPTYKTSRTDVEGLFQLDNQGYYYYNARENFAEYDSASNRFNLYDGPAVWRTDAGYNSATGAFDGAKSLGNFFPFNSASQVFDSLTADGKLTSSEGLTNVDNAVRADHHMGMTVTVDFRQPLNGMINTGSNARPMTFQFSGDDDVWIFIDDVLVLDIGGIHSELYGTIDFSTGDIHIGQSWRTNGEITGNTGKSPVIGDRETQAIDYYTLKGLFEEAGKGDTTKWNGNTFASNTSHTLKMFYLERGNYDSSLALRFNLQPLLYQQIRKVDQNGDPVEGVKFDLFKAEKTNANDSGAIPCRYTDSNTEGKRTFYIKQSNATSLVTLTTKKDGSAQFKMDDESFFNFADRGDAYYILHETTTPNGYRAQPVDIVLHYDVKTSMLSVANRWTTGAYACSVAHVTGPSKAEHGKGLVMAVPLLKKNDKWYPLYGDNLNGFHTVQDTGDAGILLAALYQARAQNKDSLADWHLSWDAANSQLKDTLSDLPGLATRYTLIDPVHGDLQLAYVQISKDALGALGVTGADPDARYASLHSILQNTAPEDVRSTIANGYTRLETNVFNREFRSLIFVPNERRELRVLKMDEDGKPLAGATFGLFDNAGCTGDSVASGTTDNNGMLVFSPTGVNDTAGQANMAWASADSEARYYLKETAAPNGYTVNDTIIPVVVGIYSIYADAGKADDGVSVMAGVGRLTQTMHQFGKPNDVDITLQDITAFMQTQKSTKDGGTFRLDGWEDVKLGNTDVLRSMNLHYNMNNQMNNRGGELVDYGLHDEDGGKYFRPFFITDTGFVRARVQQMPEREKSKYGSSAHSDANWDDLRSIHLTNLFSLLNVVVVTDTKTDPPTPSTASLTISKKVEGPGLTKADYTRNFSFRVEFTDVNGVPLTGTYQYNFYGKDKWGYLSNENNTLVLHHDESVTILGLPEGTQFKVTETDLPSGWSVTPGAEISGAVSEKEAAFTNTKGTPPPEPDGPEESEKPTPSPTPTPTATPTGTPGPSPTPGVTPAPSATPAPEPTPTAAPPTETPTYPTELPDPNDPDSPEVITIEEEGVPKTYVKVWNPETEEWEYIDEEDVPLWSAVPETGEGSGLVLWSILAALSLGGLSILTLPCRKRGGRRLRRDS